MNLDIAKDQARELMELAGKEARDLHIMLICHRDEMQKREAQKLTDRMNRCAKLESALHLALLKEGERT